ncbi:MAG: hypothetical protein NTV25_09140 [Methanothrix sp.]|nr:hypothetical protein [Methanothrix sp.]
MSGEDIGAESKLKDLQRGDESLRQEAARIVAERKRLGLQFFVHQLIHPLRGSKEHNQRSR